MTHFYDDITAATHDTDKFKKVIRMEAEKARETINRDAARWTAGSGSPGGIDMPPPSNQSSPRAVSAPHAQAFDGYGAQEWGWGLSYRRRGLDHDPVVYCPPPYLSQTRLDAIKGNAVRILGRTKDWVSDAVQSAKVRVASMSLSDYGRRWSVMVPLTGR